MTPFHGDAPEHDDGDDGGDPARGLAVGVWLSLAFWALVALAIWAWLAWWGGA